MPSELELARIRLDARKLMAVDAKDAHQLLGGIAAVEVDEDKVRYHHEAAIKLTSAVDAVRNYSISLQLIGQFEDAAKYAALAAEAQPENLSLLRSAIDFASYAGQPRKALELIQVLRKRAPDHTDAREGIIQDLLLVMDRTGLTESELQTSLKLAFQLLRDRRLRFGHIHDSILLEDGAECVHYRIYLAADAKVVRELDSQLGRLLADQLEEMHSASLLVDYGSLEVHKSVDEPQTDRVL